MKKHMNEKIWEFKDYFAKEMGILHIKGVGYSISHYFLETTIQRIKLFIAVNTPVIMDLEQLEKDGLSDTSKEAIVERFEYLLRIQDIVESEAKRYTPLDGSHWESVKEGLIKLAQSIKAGELTKEKLKIN